MALEHKMYANFTASVDELNQYAVDNLGYEIAGDYHIDELVGEGYVLTITQASTLRKEIIQEDFNFDVNLSFYIRYDKFYKGDSFGHVAFSLTFLMSDFEGDLVYLIGDGSIPALLRKNGIYYLDKKSGQMWSSRFDELNIPYELTLLL